MCHGEELRREVKMLCQGVLLELGGEQAEIFGRRLKECESRGVKEDCRRHPLYCHVMEESWTRWRPHPCSWPLLVGTMGPCWTRSSLHRQSGRQQGWGWGMAGGWPDQGLSWLGIQEGSSHEEAAGLWTAPSVVHGCLAGRNC